MPTLVTPGGSIRRLSLTPCSFFIHSPEPIVSVGNAPTDTRSIYNACWYVLACISYHCVSYIRAVSVFFYVPPCNTSPSRVIWASIAVGGCTKSSGGIQQCASCVGACAVRAGYTDNRRTAPTLTRLARSRTPPFADDKARVEGVKSQCDDLRVESIRCYVS